MSTRVVEGKKPYTGGEAISIDQNKVISLNLRDENNLIIYDSGDDEIYVDLQLPDGIQPTDAFPVGVTTGRVVVADGWDKPGTIICAKTTSGDNIKVLYADDGTLWIDNGTGLFKQIYFKADVDSLISTLTTYINTELAKKQNGVSSITAPANPVEGDLWYDTANDRLMIYDGTGWNLVGGGGGGGGSGDVLGPSSAVDGHLAVFDGTSGKLIKDGGAVPTTNTKTFYLSSTSDLTNAQAAYDWYLAGNNPIIIYDDIAYILQSKNSSPYLFFISHNRKTSDYQHTYMKLSEIRLSIASDTVTSITVSDNQLDYLDTGVNYSVSYTPQYDGSPATKKYVDDGLSNKQDTLVSGTNIKSINSNSLLGNGDLSIAEVPSGGTNGQVLTQTSQGPAWQNATGGGSDIEYVTYAEYNALLPGAESDGKHYFIYSSDVLFSYGYDFRGKTSSDLTNEGWTTTNGTSSVSNDGLLVVGTEGSVVKGGFDFSNANKITLTTLLYASGHAIWHSLRDTSSNYLACNMDVRQNFRRLDVNGSYNDGVGSSSGEKTFTTVIDLINKNIVWSVTGYQDVTKSLSDADVTLIRGLSKIELGCWSADNSSQNIFKTVSLIVA